MIRTDGKKLFVTKTADLSLVAVDSGLREVYEDQFNKINFPHNLKFVGDYDEVHDNIIFWGQDLKQGNARCVYEVNISSEDLKGLEQEIYSTCDEQGVEPEEIQIVLE